MSGIGGGGKSNNAYEYSKLSTNADDDNYSETEDVDAVKQLPHHYTAQLPAFTASTASDAIDRKWSAIVLQHNDFNKNILETSMKTTPANSCVHATYTAQQLQLACGFWRWNELKAFGRSLLRPKQFVLLVCLGIVMLYALSSSASDDVEGLASLAHVPGMKEESMKESNYVWQNESDTTVEHELPPMRQLSVNKTITTTTIEKLAQAPATTTINSNSSSSNNTSQSIITASSTIPIIPTTINVFKEFENATTTTTQSTTTILPPGYLVYSAGCKMPNLDPYLPEAMQHFKPEKYKPCSTTTPLTQIKFNETTSQYMLSVNAAAIHEYKTSGTVSCCYQSIERNYTGYYADFKYGLSECISFKGSTMLAPTIQAIIVRCRARHAEIYLDAFAMVNERADIRERLNAFQTERKLPFAESAPPTPSPPTAAYRPPNVLLLGIDSVSRSNFFRAMPHTARFLHENNWYALNGFNKIADNTFPNLMAVLTGYNQTDAYSKCKPKEVGGLDKCTYIWDLYQQHGYVTAYSEDLAYLGTFNSDKKGFLKPPTDYYMRPFYLSAEKLLSKEYKSGLIYCLGYKHASDYTYDFALEYARRYRNQPHFGLFWTNSFSHNALSDPSAMDDRMRDYLKTFTKEGLLENTIVVFFSDHGIRFGPVRRTESGHYEERLPFIYLWLPERFKRAHPQLVEGLQMNRNRLTTFFDLHMTLKHILQLSAEQEEAEEQAAANTIEAAVVGMSEIEPDQELAYNDELLAEPAAGCPNCQTLFKPVPENRACEDIGIAEHWCTCVPYESVRTNTKIIQKLAKHVVVYLNDFLQNHHNKTFSKLCAKLELSGIDSAYRAVVPTPSVGNLTTAESAKQRYRLIISTLPNHALFESSWNYDPSRASHEFQQTGIVSRLDSYSYDSRCIGDANAKKYCSCLPTKKSKSHKKS